MRKNVHGIEFEGQRLADAWEVRTWSRNGVMERSVRQVVEWTEVGMCRPALTREEYEAWLNAEYAYEPKKLAQRLRELAEEDEVKRVRSIKKAAQRAKQTCRRAIISEGFDEMLTLTYRENQEDLELTKKHFKEWVRRMKRALPGFRYCAAHEKQERGAYHWHCSTYRLPQHADYKGVKIKAWELGTKVWRDIVGEFQFAGPLQPGQAWPKVTNGLCFVGQKNRFGAYVRGRSSLAKMASYVSKYIMKDYEKSPAGTNRFSRSIGGEIGKPDVITLTKCGLHDAIQLAFEVEPGARLLSLRLGHFKDALWICTERERPPISGVSR